MIIVDTNVVSEILKPSPDPKPVDWFISQEPENLYTTTVTLAEALFGIELLPHGQRRNKLREGIGLVLEQKFAGRILSFDESSAYAFAIIAARHRKRGHTVSEFGFSDRGDSTFTQCAAGYPQFQAFSGLWHEN